MNSGQYRIPRLSIVVVVFNMRREAPRTLQSLSPQYQREIDAADYEVIVVENASTQPLSAEEVLKYGENFSYYSLPAGNQSPAAATNFGIARARGNMIGLMVDGARIVSPGLLHMALLAGQLHKKPIIGVPSWHIGPDVQQISTKQGYTAATEDESLLGIDWPNDGYRLFDISVLAVSSEQGYFYPLQETNALFLTRATIDELAGVQKAPQPAPSSLPDWYLNRPQGRPASPLRKALSHLGNFFGSETSSAERKESSGPRAPRNPETASGTLPGPAFPSGPLEERFVSPGGGYLNCDLYVRACNLPESQLILLLGEGTFHQTHDGVTTMGDPGLFERIHGEYVAIRGQPFASPTAVPLFLGRVPKPSLRFIEHSAKAAQAAAGITSS